MSSKVGSSILLEIEAVVQESGSIEGLEKRFSTLTVSEFPESKEAITNTVQENWRPIITKNSNYKGLLDETWKLIHTLDEEKRSVCVPRWEYIFNWTICPRDKLKAIVLGLDPKGETQAYAGNGMGYSVQAADDGVPIPLAKVPKSMKNIFRAVHKKELSEEDEGKYNWSLAKFSVETGILFINIVSIIDKRLDSKKDRYDEEYFKQWWSFTQELIMTLKAENKNLRIIPFYKPEDFLPRKYYDHPPYLDNEDDKGNVHPGYWNPDELKEWSLVLEDLKQNHQIEFSRIYLKE